MIRALRENRGRTIRRAATALALAMLLYANAYYLAENRSLSHLGSVTSDIADFRTDAAYGKLLPVASVPLTDGATTSLRSSSPGARVKVIAYVSRTCSASRAQLRDLRLMKSRLGRALDVLAIFGDSDPALVKSFASGMRLDFPVGLDKDGGVKRLLAVSGFPTLFVSDPSGRIVWVQSGFNTKYGVSKIEVKVATMVRERAVSPAELGASATPGVQLPDISGESAEGKEVFLQDVVGTDSDVLVVPQGPSAPPAVSTALLAELRAAPQLVVVTSDPGDALPVTLKNAGLQLTRVILDSGGQIAKECRTRTDEPNSAVLLRVRSGRVDRRTAWRLWT